MQDVESSNLHGRRFSLNRGSSSRLWDWVSCRQPGGGEGWCVHIRHKGGGCHVELAHLGGHLQVQVWHSISM